MSNAEATRRLGLSLPVDIGDEAAARIRRDVRRRMFKKDLALLSYEQVYECIDAYNDAVDTCRRSGARVRRISVVRRSLGVAPCYGMLLDWVASDGNPLPSLVILEVRGEQPVKQVDVVVTPPVDITIRGQQPNKTTRHGTEFSHMQWSF